MNKDIIEGKWTEFKGEVQKWWGDVTNDEMDKAKGNLTAIRGLIQQRYGQSKEDAVQKFDSIVDRYSSRAESSAEAVKENLRNDLRHS